MDNLGKTKRKLKESEKATLRTLKVTNIDNPGAIAQRCQTIENANTKLTEDNKGSIELK